MMYLIFLFFCLAIVAAIQIRWAWSRRRKSVQSWEQLLARAERINLDQVQRLAECYLHPDGEQFKCRPAEMWQLLGGLEGMNRLFRNTELMLDLAVFAEQWNHPEAPLVAELIRRDGVRIKRLVARMQLRLLTRRLYDTLPFDIQEAAATYFLMRSRLMGLYQVCHVARVPELTAAF